LNSRIARLTDAVRGRGKAVTIAGAAAALAGAGAGTALAATAPATHAAPPAITAHRTAGLPVTSRRTSGAAAAALTGHQAAPAAGQHTTPGTVTAAPATSTTTASSTASSTAGTAASTASAQAAAAAQTAQRDQQAAGGQLNQGGNYQFYDSVTPGQIPAGHPIATYADGPYQVQPGQVAGKNVLWVDTNGTDPGKAAVLDVEPGDATPAQAATWVQQRETQHPGQLAVVYTMRSDWSQAQQAISALPHAMQANVRWWIADPTGTPHILPGATATQWYWGPNYDISSANGTL
jgi:hypothetical protein